MSLDRPSAVRDRREAEPAAQPQGASELFRRANRRLAESDVAAAKLLAAEAARRWPRAGRQLLLEARIADSEGRPAEAGRLFREAATALRGELEEAPKDPHRAHALAQALVHCGDAEAAGAALAIARERGLDGLGALRTERRIAWLAKDWPAMREAAQRVTASAAASSAADFTALAVACRNLDDLDGASQAAAKALQRNPAQFDAAVILAQATVRQGDAAAAIASYRRLAALAPDNPRWRLQTVRFLVLSGRVMEGAAELGTALERWPEDASLRAFALISGFRTPAEIPPRSAGAGRFDIAALREQQLRRVLDGAPQDAELRRPLVVEDKASDVLVAPMPGAAAGVLVFSAMGDSVSMPLPLLDRYLAALGVTAIYLKDFQRLFYMRGVASLGASRDDTLRALREIRDGLGLRRLCTLGTSAGGFAATRYGVELAADRLLSFCGETHSRVEDLTKLEPGIAVIRRQVGAQVPAEDLDLRRFLLSRQHQSKIAWFYPEESPHDKAHALHLAGVDGVALHPVAECDDHELLRWLALNHDLRRLLVRELDLAPAA